MSEGNSHLFSMMRNHERMNAVKILCRYKMLLGHIAVCHQERSWRMAEVVLHPHVEVGMLTSPAHREGRKVWGRVAGLPKGPPRGPSERVRKAQIAGREDLFTCALGAGAVSHGRQLLEVLIILTLKAGVLLVKSSYTLRGPALCCE